MFIIDHPNMTTSIQLHWWIPSLPSNTVTGRHDPTAGAVEYSSEKKWSLGRLEHPERDGQWMMQMPDSSL